MHRHQSLLYNNSGIGLVETLLAVIFSISLILALVTLTNFNIRNSVLVERNQDSINSANRLIEGLKALKDQNFALFKSNLANCISTNCSLDVNGSIAAANINLDLVSPYSYFKAVIVSNTEIAINTVTEWKIGSKNFSSPLSTTFSNWRVRN